jgi:hypothetical protein
MTYTLTDDFGAQTVPFTRRFTRGEVTWSFITNVGVITMRKGALLDIEGKIGEELTTFNVSLKL